MTKREVNAVDYNGADGFLVVLVDWADIAQDARIV